MMIFIHLFSEMIIKTPAFDRISIIVILLNSAVMAFDTEPDDPPIFFQIADDIFLYLYTLEAALKIVGLGFIMDENAYIKDPWNCLDFSIAIISWSSVSSSVDEAGPAVALQKG